jgi:hypothetical protein
MLCSERALASVVITPAEAVATCQRSNHCRNVLQEGPRRCGHTGTRREAQGSEVSKQARQRQETPAYRLHLPDHAPAARLTYLTGLAWRWVSQQNSDGQGVAEGVSQGVGAGVGTARHAHTLARAERPGCREPAVRSLRHVRGLPQPARLVLVADCHAALRCLD